VNGAPVALDLVLWPERKLAPARALRDLHPWIVDTRSCLRKT
jgi:hypothetical protein